MSFPHVPIISIKIILLKEIKEKKINKIYIDTGTYYTVIKTLSNIVQQVYTWSNWNWSKEYTSSGPIDYHLDLQSKVQMIWSKEYRALARHCKVHF